MGLIKMRNILVLGASEELFKIIENSLNADKYKLSETIDSKIENLSVQDYSLILLDDDINVEKIVNEIDKKIPIVIMAAAGEKEQILESLSFSNIDYVVKDELFSNFLPKVVESNLAELREQSPYYESLFKKNDQILLLIDPETGKIVDANTRAVDFYGWSKEELLDKKIIEINTLSKEEVFAEMMAAKEEDRSYFRFEHRLKDGTTKDVEVYSTPITIEGRNLLYSMVYDITKRHQLEEELAWQEEKYKVLFETTGTATIIVEEDTTISLANRQMAELTGYTKEELEGGMSWTDLIAYQEELERLKRYHQARRQDDLYAPNSYEFHLKDKYGAVKNVVNNIRTLPNKEQSIASMQDITDLKEKEEKLNQNIEKARQLHQKFLPQSLIDFGEVAAASYYLPAEKLGGDFYNLERIDDKLIFYLADVSGHGLDGALLNISIKEKISNIIAKSKEELTVGEILETIYQEYQEDDFPEDYFVCIQIGILDLDTFKLNYNNAGFHIAPLLISSKGNIALLNKYNLPVSTVIPKHLIDFYDDDYQLQAGDKLILVTDGLYEERKEQGMYGQDHLMELLEEYYTLPAEILVKEIKEDFENFLDQKGEVLNNSDDITLVILELEHKNRIELKINSQLELIEEVERKIIDFLIPYCQELMEIRMGLHEMLANAIEHGNDLNEEQEVKVEAAAADDYIRIIIEDQGAGFDYNKKLARSLEDTGCEGRGRGIIITRDIFDQIKYNKEGNKVALIKFQS